MFMHEQCLQPYDLHSDESRTVSLVFAGLVPFRFERGQLKTFKRETAETLVGCTHQNSTAKCLPFVRREANYRGRGRTWPACSLNP